MNKQRSFLALIVLAFLLAACQPAATPAPAPTPTAAPAVDLAAVLKTVESAPGGWKPAEEIKYYTKDTLFDLMDGQSDAFFVYGFEKAAVRRFTSGAGLPLIVLVFQVDRPASAYGLFSVNRDPQPLAMGSEGSGSPGQRLSFWQDRYFVQLTALKTMPDAGLQAVGQGIAAALPKGGQTPALVGRLPKEGRLADAQPLFFHQELSIQDRVWLGGENRLGLGLDSDGVLGQYNLGGQTVSLVLIEYPSASRADKGLQALKPGDGSEFLAGKVKDKTLAAVFGQADPAAAQKLVEEALKESGDE